ncbi:MAG: hypothetical protein L6R39_000923 [Caloplaca ligustica]|nr:MAG: hypothetical protein L6R39_000923 [Caloplaca ligustica]
MKGPWPHQRAQGIYRSCCRRCVSSQAATKTPGPLDPDNLVSYHWDTVPPTSKQRRYAEQFFLRQRSKILYSSSTFRNVPRGNVKEVTFLGRSNVGKSSLLNKLMGENICHTSRNPGRTRTMNFFAVGGEDEQGNPGRLTVLDMPGYGHKSRAEWGEEIMKYLVGRRQYVVSDKLREKSVLADIDRLARAFVLIDSKHGLKQTDEALLQALRENAISHQIVLSKVDRILFPKNRQPSRQLLERNAAILQERAGSIGSHLDTLDVSGPKALGEILACSTTASLERGKFLGINNLRWSILAATGLHKVRRQARTHETGPLESLAPGTPSEDLRS